MCWGKLWQYTNVSKLSQVTNELRGVWWILKYDVKLAPCYPFPQSRHFLFNFTYNLMLPFGLPKWMLKISINKVYPKHCNVYPKHFNVCLHGLQIEGVHNVNAYISYKWVFDSIVKTTPDTFQKLCAFQYGFTELGGCFNIKISSYQYRGIKYKTVSPTVLSLTWESPYLGKTIFILRRALVPKNTLRQSV